MTSAAPTPASPRTLSQAETYTPELLHEFLRALELTKSSLDVWKLIVAAGQQVGLPYVDFISAGGLKDWRPTLFVRTSYDSSWLDKLYRDGARRDWSYFRTHAMRRYTPILVGWEFVDESEPVPEDRLQVLHAAAAHGLRAGFCIPLRQNAPPQSAMITYSGDHAKREMRAIVRAHGWALHAIALIGHQRYLLHFASEFNERNKITPKQLALLELIGAGLQDRQIADRLGISVSAVRQRMDTLRTRTGTTSRSELAALAMSLGILPDPIFAGKHDSADTLVEMDGVGVRLRRSQDAQDEQ